MKKLLFLLFFLTTVVVFAKKSSADIVLKGDNFFAITDAFDEYLLEDFNKKVMTYSGKELYIYIDSPGGSVIAMNRIINIIKTTNIKFICVARFAASAAFMTFQACDERLILPDGVLMSHNASMGLEGELPRIKTLFTVMEDLVYDAEISVAKRMKMCYKDYKAAINNNMWLSRKSATKMHAIDGVANSITCSKELVESVVDKTTIKCNMFSCTVDSNKFSGCPLLTQPLPQPEKKADASKASKTSRTKRINTTIKDLMWILPDYLRTSSF